MRFLSKEQKKKIGYEYILDNINTVTNVGAELKYNSKPFTIENKSALAKELENTEKFIDCITKNKEMESELGFFLCKFKDLRATFSKVKKGSILDEIELFEIKSFSKLCNDISIEYSKTGIDVDAICFRDVKPVFRILDPDNLNIDTFFIYDSYSPDLKETRFKRTQLELRISQTNDPDTRSSLLSERMEIVSKEHELEFEIKKELTAKIKTYIDALVQNTDVIGYMDFLLAKARYFKASNAVKPEIVEDSNDIGDALELYKTYNPYYSDIMARKHKTMTALDITIQRGVTLLTGANMGGKSICMKTVALNVLLANSGMYVYADSARIPMVDFLYMISDDLQNVESGLSTFGAEIMYLKKIIAASKHKNGLIILDELARGTNPHEGKILLQAVIEFFKKQKSYTFISTHFDGIPCDDIIHLQVVGISKINFEKLSQLIDLNKGKALDIIQEYMDYSIEETEANEVPQNALQIAKLLGLDSRSL